MAIDNLNRVTDDEPLAVVPLSRAYDLVVVAALIGRATAVELKLRHRHESGEVSFRGGFSIFVQKLPELIAALERAKELL